VPEIVINEIIQNPSAVSDGNGEWFELFNAGDSAVDIDGWTIQDNDSDSHVINNGTIQDNDSDSHVINNGGPLMISSGGFLVLGVNGDSSSNGGVSVDYVYSGLALANGGDELVLIDGTMTEIDRVEWDNGATFPDPNGASMSVRPETSMIVRDWW
jgi:hypothetical protein